MRQITDDNMRQMLLQTKSYCIVILKAGPNKHEPGVDKIIWEHGRRNFALRADGVLPIVCPVADGSDVSGVGIFDATVEDARTIMDEDPGVQAGVFVYELHACRGFPGSSLPARQMSGQAKQEEDEKMSDTDALDKYRRALDGFDAVIRAVPADKWEAASPCAEWRAVDVLGHLIWGQRMLQAWATGSEPPPQPSPPGMLAGADPAAAWAVAQDTTLAALTPETLDRTVATRNFGRIRLAQFVETNVIDLLAHAWDLARATGQDVRLDAELVRERHAWACANEAAIRQPGGVDTRRRPTPTSRRRLWRSSAAASKVRFNWVCFIRVGGALTPRPMAN